MGWHRGVYEVASEWLVKEGAGRLAACRKAGDFFNMSLLFSFFLCEILLHLSAPSAGNK